MQSLLSPLQPQQLTLERELEQQSSRWELPLEGMDSAWSSPLSYDSQLLSFRRIARAALQDLAGDGRVCARAAVPLPPQPGQAARALQALHPRPLQKGQAASTRQAE